MNADKKPLYEPESQEIVGFEIRGSADAENQRYQRFTNSMPIHILPFRCAFFVLTRKGAGGRSCVRPRFLFV